MTHILHLDPSTVAVKTGHYYNKKYYHTIITEDTDCFVGDHLLFSFRKNVLNNEKWLPIAKKHLQKSILTSDKRKIAGATSSRKLVNSGIIGYYDGLTPQMKADLGGVNKAGRATAYTANYPQDWLSMVPLFQELNEWYQRTSPFYYNIQKKEARRVEPSLLINNTVFSTITVNRDWRTATHTDRGNFSGLSCIAVLGEKFKGGYLGFPRYKVAVDVGAGDAILMDGHEPHCNTELSIQKGGCRFSMVCYLRKNMSLFHVPVYVKDHLYYVQKT